MTGHSSPARCGVMISHARPYASAMAAVRRSWTRRSGVRATMTPPHRANPVSRPTSPASREYSSVEYWTSRVPLSEARNWPTSPAACQVVPQESRPCSSSSTSRQPAAARWYATPVPITPPPMITMRARCGSSAIDYLIPSLHIVQQPGEVLAGEAARRAFEALHRPGPEIEVQRAGRVLDRPPQRPAVLAHQAEDPGPGDLVPQRRPVVAGDQLGERVQGQPALTPDVAQLETGVVVAGILVVDQPDPLAVVDEVRGEQVVVAGDCGGLADRERRAGVGDVPHQVVVPGGDGKPVLPRRGPVALLDGEHVEIAEEPRAGVQQPA